MTPGIGKLRGLQQLSNNKGLFMMVAMDHRGSLEKMLAGGLRKPISFEDMVDFKMEVCRATGSYCSALLLDPIYGAAQAVAAGVVPGGTGMLVSLEESGYKGDKRARLTELLPGWGPEKIKRMGASAAKLLVYFRPDLKDITARQLQTVREVATECLKVDLPLLVETVSYPVNEKEDDPREFAKIKPQLVIETARQLSDIPMDVLKTEFPGDLDFEKDEARVLENCRRLDEATTHPWVILSGGHEFKVFRREVEIACKGGASGFLAGRALWQEVVGIQSRQARIDFFDSTVVNRLAEIVKITNSLGKPWPARLRAAAGEGPLPGEDWYKTY